MEDTAFFCNENAHGLDGTLKNRKTVHFACIVLKEIEGIQYHPER
jgi:hypothetical protein